MKFQMRLNMKTNLKVALSAFALAALVAAPATAKSHLQATAFQNDQVVVDGKVIGADPDANIRGQIRRDNRSYGN
jgi:hypothetical protein